MEVQPGEVSSSVFLTHSADIHQLGFYGLTFLQLPPNHHLVETEGFLSAICSLQRRCPADTRSVSTQIPGGAVLGEDAIQ